MQIRSLFVTGAAVGALLLAASAASAETGRSAGPAGAPIAQGPPIAGYCVFSLNEVIGTSRVGQSVVARLKELGAQVNAELQPEADSIRTEEGALQGQANTMDSASLQRRQGALQARVDQFEKLEQLRQQEMQATQQKQFGVILKDLDPIMRTLYQEHHCSILVDGDAGGVRMVNPEMDLSRTAVSELDQRITSLTFDREHLDTQPGAAPSGGR